MINYMKITKTIIIVSIIFFIIIFLFNPFHIENMSPMIVDKNNKEYMDMLISTTSIFGGIFVIVAIIGLTNPITIANPAIPKPYSSRTS
jgi:heme O synthase-like polyprenyltransferase